MIEKIEKYLPQNELTRLANEEFLKSSTHLFLSKTPIVFCNEEEFPTQMVSDVISFDIPRDDNEALVSGLPKFFNYIPNIKVGSTIGEAIKSKIKEGNLTESFVVSWREALVKDLVRGVKNRMEMLCAAVPSNGVTNKNASTTLNVDFLLEKELQLKSDWSTENCTPVTDLELLKTKGTSYGKLYDRIILSAENLRKIFKSEEFLHKLRELILAKSLKENNPEFDKEGKLIWYDEMKQLLQYLEEILEMEVILSDATYRVKGEEKSKMVRYLKDDLVVLSSTADDNNNMSEDFGVVPNKDGNYVECYVSMETGNEDSLAVFAVIKGFPRLHDRFKYATLQV